MLILPVLGSLFTGLLMFYLVGAPVAELLQWLSAWLRGMQGASALLLGLLLGAMMAFDMGGPVNKAAYAFSTGMIASQVYTPMAAAMIAGMTPPLGLALATRLFADRFTREERGSAASAGVLGLAFVTEGPFPMRPAIRCARSRPWYWARPWPVPCPCWRGGTEGAAWRHLRRAHSQCRDPCSHVCGGAGGRRGGHGHRPAHVQKARRSGPLKQEAGERLARLPAAFSGLRRGPVPASRRRSSGGP